MAEVRVMHYLNQFFAGMGGEDKADTPLDFREGPVGPGKRLQTLLGDSAKIVVTTFCGDNYFSLHMDEALPKIQQTVRDKGITMVIAGPAFANGRYGFSCVEVCHYLSTSSGLNGVTAMYIENPGVDSYKQYKDARIFLLPTPEPVTAMEDALSRIAKFVSRLSSGSAVGPAADEGYVPRGIRVNTLTGRGGAVRAVNMLLDKLGGRPFQTEIPIEVLETVPVPPGLPRLADACIALGTTSGVVPLDNPDRFKQHCNTEWKKYSLEKLNSMQDAKWDVIHGGYATGDMLENPNYGVPLDACRLLEKEKVFAKLYPYFYSSTGVGAWISAMQTIGRNIAADMKSEGVDAVLLTST